MSSFASRFKAGSDIAEDLINTYEMGQRKKAFGEIASAQDAPDFTAEERAAMEAKANAVDATGKPIFTMGTDAQGNVTSTLNQDAVPGAVQDAYTPAAMARSGVNYLGKTYDAPLSDGQRLGAQQQAMAGVLDKSGDIEGAMRYRQQAQQGALADRQLAQGDARFANDQEMFKLNKESAERQAEAAKVKAAQDAAGRHINDVLQKNGGDVRKAAAQMMTETGSGGLEGVNVSYEVGRDGMGRFVKVLPDGTRDAGQPIKPGAEGDLQVWHQITSAISDPKTVGDWYGDKLKRELEAEKTKSDQANKDRGFKLQEGSLGIQQAQLGLSQSSHNEKRADTAALRTAGVEYEAARQQGSETGMKAATLKLIQAGGTAPGGSNANDPAEVKLANAYIRAGLAGNLAEGLQLATSSKDSSPDRLRAGIYGKALTAKAGNATQAQKATEEAMAYLLPGGAKPSRSASDKVGNMPAFKDAAEADAAVKAGKLKPGDKVSIGGRTATWQ